MKSYRRDTCGADDREESEKQMRSCGHQSHLGPTNTKLNVQNYLHYWISRVLLVDKYMLCQIMPQPNSEIQIILGFKERNPGIKNEIFRNALKFYLNYFSTLSEIVIR